jgi:hypothetical protein
MSISKRLKLCVVVAMLGVSACASQVPREHVRASGAVLD